MDNKKFNVYGPANAVRDFLFRKKFLCHQGVLIAVSGGVDSIVLAHIISTLNIKSAVAHCNFKLRDDESDEDETFVKNNASKLQLPFYTKSFDTKKYAVQNKLSVQVAARVLRYEWLESLRKELNFGCIATAHHANDNAETILQHIIDGSGLAGLRGIPEENEFVVRPLLRVFKNELVEYAIENKLQYRNDSSNEKTNYTRNKIRHELIPLLSNFNPSIVETLNADATRWNDAFLIYNHSLKKLKRKLLKQVNQHFTIHISSLRSYEFAPTLLYELLKDFGFNSHQADEIRNALDVETGKQFYSNTHRVIKDRTQLIVAKKEIASFHQVVENGNATFELPNGKLSFEQIANSPEINFTNTRYQYLDADKLQFPLTLRPWKKGDYIYPFGLNKKKKISDVFTDKKLSLPEKEEQPLLQSGEHVVALPGLLIDHRFRVTSSTRSLLKIFYQGKALR